MVETTLEIKVTYLWNGSSYCNDSIHLDANLLLFISIFKTEYHEFDPWKPFKFSEACSYY